MVIQPPYRIGQKHHVIGCTRKCHDKQHCPKTHKPLWIHVWKKLHQYFSDDTCFPIYKFIAGYQHYPAVDQGGHKTHAEELGALNIEVFGKQND